MLHKTWVKKITGFIMKKIRVLFLSVKSSLLYATKVFFDVNPLIFSLFDEYNNLNKYRKKCDVVVFDDTSLNSNELDIIISALTDERKYKKILYTDRTDKDYLQFYESHSIDGIVSKWTDIKILEEAIIKTSEGEKYRCEYIKDFLDGNDPIHSKIKSLSIREIEIVRLRKQGYTNLEMAQELNLSIKTIEAHFENIKIKLDLKSVKGLRNFF